MTGFFPTRPDGLVDGTRIPHDALTGGCAHEHAARAVAHIDGCDDVWHCRDCGERWRVAAGLAQSATLPDRYQPAERSPILAHADVQRIEYFVSLPDLVVVPDPDTTTGPSGLLARFRHTRKA